MLIFILAFSLVTAATPQVDPGECVVFAPLEGADTIVGGSECSRRTLPASTFKVPHALIGLETQVITDKTVMKWDGEKMDFPTWERDHSLDSAIRWSALWFFQRMAASIGRERELEYLRAFRYGTATFTHEVTRFWLNGDLTISPIEQVSFLRRLFSYELPVDRRHIETVKTALVMPSGKLSNASGLHDFALQWPAVTIVRAKTGNGTVDGERVSWLVGALETNGRWYVFASRARSSTRSLDTTAGADLALRVLNSVETERSAR
jgi:beta-lactamase class D